MSIARMHIGLQTAMSQTAVTQTEMNQKGMTQIRRNQALSLTLVTLISMKLALTVLG